MIKSEATKGVDDNLISPSLAKRIKHLSYIVFGHIFANHEHAVRRRKALARGVFSFFMLFLLCFRNISFQTLNDRTEIVCTFHTKLLKRGFQRSHIVSA